MKNDAEKAKNKMKTTKNKTENNKKNTKNDKKNSWNRTKNTKNAKNERKNTKYNTKTRRKTQKNNVKNTKKQREKRKKQREKHEKDKKCPDKHKKQEKKQVARKFANPSGWRSLNTPRGVVGYALSLQGSVLKQKIAPNLAPPPFRCPRKASRTKQKYCSWKVAKLQSSKRVARKTEVSHKTGVLAKVQSLKTRAALHIKANCLNLAPLTRSP